MVKIIKKNDQVEINTNYLTAYITLYRNNDVSSLLGYLARGCLDRTMVTMVTSSSRNAIFGMVLTIKLLKRPKERVTV